MGFLNGLIDWTKVTFLPLGWLGLFIVAFIESSFFPVPPDLLVIVLSLASPDRALFFAFVSTLGSVLGAIFGYWLGIKGGLPLLKKMFSKKSIEKAHYLYNKYESWAIFIGAFTPIPFKVFTISAGVFYVNFRRFVFVSIIGRGLRYFAEAILIMLYGQKIIDFLDKYFDIVTMIVVVLGIVGYLVYKKWCKK